MNKTLVENLLILALILVGCCLSSSIVVEADDMGLYLLYALGVFGFGFVIFPRLLGWFRRRTRASRPDALQVMAKDTRPPVVYLRSFQADGTRDTKPTFVMSPIPTYLPKPTYEEQIAPYFARIGPFVALSAADYGPPELGAARLMTTDANWQQTFSDLVRRCSLVVFRAGDSQSLTWELNQLVRQVDPRKVIIYLQIGDEPDRAVQQARYDQFRRLTATIFPRPLPVERGKQLYLAFEAGWEPFMGKSLRKVLRAKGF